MILYILNNAIIKARQERNDALLLARHYQDVAEKCKIKNRNLQIEIEIDSKQQLI